MAVEIEVVTVVEIKVEAEVEEEEEAGGREERADILLKGTVGKYLPCKNRGTKYVFWINLKVVPQLTHLPFVHVDTSSRGHSRSLSPQEPTNRGRSPNRRISRSPSHHSTSKSPDGTAGALPNAGPALLHVSSLTNNVRYIIWNG